MTSRVSSLSLTVPKHQPSVLSFLAFNSSHSYMTIETLLDSHDLVRSNVSVF